VAQLKATDSSGAQARKQLSLYGTAKAVPVQNRIKLTHYQLFLESRGMWGAWYTGVPVQTGIEMFELSIVAGFCPIRS
jgi:hypothetical protein